MRRSPVRIPWFAAVTAFLLAFPAASRAQPAADAKGATWLVLVAVKEYDDHPRIPNLRLTVSDADRLKRNLCDRAGVRPDRILELTSAQAKPERKPTIANIRKEIPAFLKAVKPEDTVILFYSGHGMLVDRRTCIVPGDAQLADKENTMLPAVALKEMLYQTKAKAKIVMFDCCHAGGKEDGTAKFPVDQVAMARDMADPDEKNGVVFIGSCGDKELSIEAPSLKGGLFSYWLSHALQGAADANGDGELTAEELYQYVQKRVSGMARDKFRKDQNPVRHLGVDVREGTVLRLSPQTVDSMCENLASQIDAELKIQKLKSIAVLEFVINQGQKRRFGEGGMPLYAAKKIEENLAEMGGGLQAGEADYRVVPRRDVDERLKNRAADSLETSGADLSKIVDCYATGEVRIEGGNAILQCKLFRSPDDQLLQTFTGVSENKTPIRMKLDESMAGEIAGDNLDNRKRPEGAATDPAVVDFAQKPQDWHPLDPGNPDPFPLDVVFENPVTFAPKLLYFEKADGWDRGFLRVRPGDSLRLKFRNKFPYDVGMHVLVDGLNVLGKRPEVLGRGQMFVIRAGNDVNIGRFLNAETNRSEPLVVSSPVAPNTRGRQRYGEVYGRVIVGVYANLYPNVVAPVGRGKIGPEPTSETNFVPGKLLGVYSFQYLSPDYRK